jgi:predicted MPP superfamily phosphohydrolase
MRKDKYLKNIISKIEIEKPDVVFILGDLIDGSVIPYDKWLNEFSSLKSEFGNIYVEGNHEKYSQEYNTFKSAIPESLINLTNKKVIINNTQIIGLDYIQGESLTNITAELKSLNYDATVPSIILIHDPKNVANLSTEKVSLVLSGHTHGGQLFPFTILLKSLYKKYIHGVTYTESTASVTSSGVGTSIIPLRVGTTPEIIVLTIK